MLRRVAILVVPPLVLYLALLVVAGWWPTFATWASQPVVRALPFMLLAAAGVLGLFFTQSRIAFTSLLLLVALLTAARARGLPPDDPHVTRLLLWAGVIIPIAFAVFHRLQERGVWSVHGAARFAISAVAGGFLALLPQLSVWPAAPVLAPTTTGLLVPPLAAMTTAVCLVVLFLPRAFESRALGPLMATAALCALTALNGAAATAAPGRAQSMLLFFMSAAGLLMAIAVLDSAWRKANMDELTQLPARHALKHHLARLGPAYTVGLIDIDHFKLINDRHGHAVGDQVLRFVASRLRAHAPGRVYRFGGEEFVIVCDGAGAQTDAIEAARRAIGSEPFRLRGQGRPRRRPDAPPADARRRARSLRVTASAGVAANHGEVTDPYDVIKSADKALYRAKKTGRDRLCVSGKG